MLSNKLKQLARDVPPISLEETLNVLEGIQPLFVNSISRKSSGSELTPVKIVHYMLDEVSYRSKSVLNKKLLDPSCGSGVFILGALERYLTEFEGSTDELINCLIQDKMLVAIDLNPINVVITKLGFVLKLIQASIKLTRDQIYTLLRDLPIHEGNTLEKPSLFSELSSVVNDDQYDVIVGNPPYIRLHRLPKATREDIKESYESATGRFDLYVCFIEKAVHMLREGGRISLITSNKFLTANYGKGIRNFLLSNIEILHLVDLHDTEFFEAAVLPSIITGMKNKSDKKDEFLFSSLKKSNNKEVSAEKVDNVFFVMQDLMRNNSYKTIQLIVDSSKKDILVELSHSIVKRPEKNNQWNFSSSSEEEIKKHLEGIGHQLLGHIADVCVGIKPNPNEVFVDSMTSDFIKQRDFERDVIYPILRKDNISRWKVSWTGSDSKDRYVLYPHTMSNGKGIAVDIDKYPNVKEYLYEHENILKGREYLVNSKTRKWYEIWVPHDLDKFSKPKIVTRDISESNNFTIDLDGYICLGSLFFITLKDQFTNQYISNLDMLNYLLGLCNSNVLEFYQKTISGSLYSKKVRYTTTNMNRWIVPEITCENERDIQTVIKIVKEINDDRGSLSEKEKLLNKAIYNIFNLNDLQIHEIEQYLKTNS
ncbi:Eco57I restriction-modification methylase domain-containing protein [Paenibacillus odorifer]|uniref:site-specific DNA-methyltransferase (adenine-specific) n=1 Tax=Paenibacillus odorifer TaxID=189426 RepID=A0ABX3GN01_9BACL|nr:N-6 DNA methylase [Paenibacillus odorifer]OMD28127.1 hypothetical protein BSO21_19700 [Paenibacillus odorifer]